MMLSGLTPVRLESLRQGMVGTSKILDKSELDISWGPTASRLIDEIRDHASYASSRYYRWIYRQYFGAIYDSLAAISRATKSAGQGMLVVQDSFYKDIYIDLGTVVVEMLSTLSLDGRVVQSEPIKTNLRHLNPRRSLGHAVAH